MDNKSVQQQAHHGFKGVIRFHKAVEGFFSAEIRPPNWTETIWLGAYETKEEAARAYDVGVFYTNAKGTYNFDISKVDLPPMSCHLEVKLKNLNLETMKEFSSFVLKEAREAAGRVKLKMDPLVQVATKAEEVVDVKPSLAEVVNTRTYGSDHVVVSEACRKFLENLQGTVFYSVPTRAQLGSLTRLKWDWEMIGMDFEDLVPADHISFAFVEGKYSVSSSILPS